MKDTHDVTGAIRDPGYKSQPPEIHHRNKKKKNTSEISERDSISKFHSNYNQLQFLTFKKKKRLF